MIWKACFSQSRLSISSVKTVRRGDGGLTWRSLALPLWAPSALRWMRSWHAVSDSGWPLYSGADVLQVCCVQGLRGTASPCWLSSRLPWAQATQGVPSHPARRGFASFPRVQGLLPYRWAWTWCWLQSWHMCLAGVFLFLIVSFLPVKAFLWERM